TGQRQPFARDVLPNIELGPVGYRENAWVFARVDARVVQVPELGPLILRIPLAEGVAHREDTFLRSCLFLVPPGSADQRVESELLDCLQQRDRLRGVPRIVGVAQLDGA